MGSCGRLARQGRPALSLLFAVALTRDLPAQQHRVVELLVPKQTAPNILSGTFTSADGYTVVQQPSIAQPVWFNLKTYRNWGGSTVDEQLQMFINVSNSATKVTIELDFDHTRLTTTGRRRRIEITKNPSSSMPCSNCMTVFNVTDNVPITFPTSTALCDVSPQPCNNPGPPWTLEFRISAAQLQVNTIPALIGMYMTVSGGGAVTTIYPTALLGEPATSVTNLDTWAHVRSRNPVDFAMMLDRSGSMLAKDGTADSRWTRATRATDVLSAALSFFKEPMIDDKIAVAQYSWDCGNDMSGNRIGALAPGGSTNGISIPSTPVRLTTGSTAPLPGYCTPIQKGLEFAFNQEVGPLVQDHDRIVVLLSDGLHNMPSGDVPINLNSTLLQHPDVVQVIAVAMLPDGTGGTMLMDQIADRFRGPAFKPRYDNLTPGTDFAQMLGVYLKPLENLLAINRVEATGGTFQPGEADKLVFIGAWNVAANASDLNVTNSAAAAFIVSQFKDQITGYAAAIVTSPPATGTWSVSATGATQPDATYLLVDMKLYAQFLVEQRQYSAGEPILLTVDLRDEGRPVLGADVTFDLERPALGLGDFLSTIQQGCTFAPPTVPVPPPLDSIRARLKLTAAVGAHVATPTGSGDPLPGRYLLAADHFQRCGEDVLGRAHNTGIRMRDDGVPPDVEKDDGVYATAYTPPEEGSYNLRFLVSGKTTDGAPFERTYRLSDFARITPSAEATQQIVQNGGIVNGRQVTHILLLFRDSLGNYLGPRLGEFLKVRVTGAHVIDSLADAGNGYYRITIDHTPGGPEPTVSVSMPGSTYEQRVDLSPGDGRLFALSLHAGVSMPHGTLNGTHDAGFGITADAEYWWKPRLAVATLAGYHRFNGQGANPDLDLVHASVALEAKVTTGQPSVMVDGGAGIYDLSPGPTDPGVHAGAGLEFEVSPTVALGFTGRVHTVFTTGSNTTFSSLQAGGRIRF